jgi:hypothetical protein
MWSDGPFTKARSIAARSAAIEQMGLWHGSVDGTLRRHRGRKSELRLLILSRRHCHSIAFRVN